MGANAQTSVPLFVANQVLTASQQNLSAATGVPVFATTVTRDAAFGGSNKALAEGQLCYIEASDIVQYYTGAAWATVGPATASALVRVGGGALSGASTTFSSVFSATYDAYKVVLTNLLSTDHTYFQIGSATTAYYSCGAKVTYGATVSGNGGNNTSQFERMGYSAGTNYFGATIEIQNPFLSVETTAQWTFMNVNPADGSAIMSGFLDTTASYTSIKIGASSGNLTGTCNIYGYSLS
jgi:hypothetical protein